MLILLVEPDFPIPNKSKNHKDFLPIGLLKLASYHRSLGDEVRLVRGNVMVKYQPDLIEITSLFTYWSRYVWESVWFYKKYYPKSKVVVGGIYASLMPEHCKKSGCDDVFVGIHGEAEKFKPAYDLVDVDYQIIHTSRGCIRKCKFCGTWMLEPKFTFKKLIKDEINSNRIIFYDNNLLANPFICDILSELIETKYNDRVVYSESQCGIDGRLLNPELAKLLKKARFLNPRIAWDNDYSQKKEIEKQIHMLLDAGYIERDIYIFMIYNYRRNYVEMKNKIKKCKEWGVQIADCRYRPLDQTFDNYKPNLKQTSCDYYIRPNWTDRQIKLFRRNVRRQNIMIRHGFGCYDAELEIAGAKRRRERNEANNLCVRTISGSSRSN